MGACLFETVNAVKICTCVVRETICTYFLQQQVVVTMRRIKKGVSLDGALQVNFFDYICRGKENYFEQ
jgi:hypothetical protein